MKDVLVIEPFYGGSHGQLVNLLCSDDMIGPRIKLFSLPAKKWHWKARTSALYLSQIIESSPDYRILFCSSVLNLTELVSLRPDLAKLKKVIYFHENQLIYPVRKNKDRDFHYGYSQILSTMVADEVIFNSEYNKESFLDSISHHLKLIPDHRPRHLVDQIRPKCRVIYFPLTFVGKRSVYGCDDEYEQLQSCHTQERRKDLSSVNSIHSSLNILSSQNNLDDCNLKESSFSSNASHPVADGSSLSDSNPSTCFGNIHGPPNKINHADDEDTRPHQFPFYNECQKCETNAQYSPSNIKSDSTEKCDRDADFSSHNGLFVKINSHGVSCKETAEEPFENPQTNKRIICQSHPPLHIVWPHRWEHDKGPQAFFDALFQLQDDGFDFVVSVVGETFSEIPDIFNIGHSRLGPKIHAWGYQSRQDYIEILKSAHVVVSTAEHEFFGVSMLEATSCGCFPLCPKRLVYPEIYPSECLYSTNAQLVKRLKQFCRRPDKFSPPFQKIKMHGFSWECLKKDYRMLLLTSP